MQMILDACAESTQRCYGTGWTKWVNFCTITGDSPLLVGETKEECVREEDVLLNFAAHQSLTMGRAAGTIKQYFMSVRWTHVTTGLGDPLIGKRRVWLLLKALKRERAQMEQERLEVRAEVQEALKTKGAAIKTKSAELLKALKTKMGVRWPGWTRSASARGPGRRWGRRW